MTKTLIPELTFVLSFGSRGTIIFSFQGPLSTFLLEIMVFKIFHDFMKSTFTGHWVTQFESCDMTHVQTGWSLIFDADGCVSK